jgi:hypothetical protein
MTMFSTIPPESLTDLSVKDSAWPDLFGESMMTKNSISLSYLRAFITILVLAFHSIAAYITFAPKANTFSPHAYSWLAFPVVDSARWVGFDLFFLFNDAFFMSMMFFISGIFVWGSIERKCARQYLRDRFIRLGIPFVVATLFIIPLSYYPSYLLGGSPTSVGDYLSRYMTLPAWPLGPCWFIGVLLALEVLAAFIFSAALKQMEVIGKILLKTQSMPLTLFLALSVISFLLYFPMAAAFGPLRWFTLGPVQITAARSLLYPFWFFVGVAVGMSGIQRGILDSASQLTRNWLIWIFLTAASFTSLIYGLIQVKKSLGHVSPLTALLTSVAFTFCCTGAIFMLLALFLRYVKRGNAIADRVASNAYGMYLVHYVFVTWTQFLFVGKDMPVALKAAFVFGSTAVLSWITVEGVRCIPIANRILTNGVMAAKFEPSRIG